MLNSNDIFQDDFLLDEEKSEKRRKRRLKVRAQLGSKRVNLLIFFQINKSSFSDDDSQLSEDSELEVLGKFFIKLSIKFENKKQVSIFIRLKQNLLN